MNLDRCIRVLLTTLSKKYKFTIIEITVANDGKINKNYRVSYVHLETIKEDIPLKEEFKNKRDLVKWLMGLQ